MGAGATKRLSAVRWGVAGNIVVAWLLTIPAAALVAAALLLPDRGDLLVRLGVGSGSGEMFDAASRRRARTRVASPRRCEQRFREYPGGPVTQDEVKELEHEGDRIVSELLRSVEAQFVPPYDREDIITLAFAIDEVPDKIENASELLGLYGVEPPTRQSLELCGLLVEATERAREAARRA